MPRHLAALRLALLVAIAAAGVACGSATEPSPSGTPPDGALPSFAGTSWVVLTVDGRAPVPGAVPTIMFDASTVSGTGGCNQIGGAYQHDPGSGRFAVGDLRSTEMFCQGAGVMDFEAAFLRALSRATQAARDATGNLVLSGPGSRIVLATLEHPGQGG